MDKQGMLRKIGNQMQSLVRLARMIRALPDLGEAIDVYTPGSNSVHIKIPFDMPTYRRIRQKVARNGWVPDSTWAAPDGDKFTRLHQDGITLIIIMIADHEKSTCKLVPDGEETIQIMRAVCS